MERLSYLFLLELIAPVFVLLVIGFGVRRRRILTREADSSLMQLLIKLLYPALILRFVLGNAALDQLNNLLLAPLLGVITVLLGFFVSWKASRFLPAPNRIKQGTFAYTTGLFNYGFFPIPIALALFGEAGSSTVAVLLLFNVGVEIAMWTVGILFITSTSGEKLWKRILNAPSITLLAALVIHFVGLGERIPAFVTETIDWLSRCAVPLGILLSGATLADLLRDEKGLFRDRRTPGIAISLRLILLPVCFLLLARYLPWASEELRRVIVLQAAMPSAILPLVINRHYGGDNSTAVLVVLSTTLLGLLTIPWWISLGFNWMLP